MANLGLLSFVATNEGNISYEKINNVNLYESNKEIMSVVSDGKGNECFCLKNKETQIGIFKEYKNGIEKISYIHKNTVRDGMYMEFYEEVNTLKFAMDCKNGTQDGIARHYTEEGVLVVEGNFIKGKIHGLCKTFRPDGTKFKEMYYNHGSMYMVTEFYPSGNPRCVFDVKDNQVNGMCKFFHENGFLDAIVPYVNGKIHGLEKRYDERGILVLEVNYHDDVKHGSCTHYDPQGNITDIYLYQDGNIVKF